MNQWEYNDSLRQRCGPDVPPLAPWLRPLQRIMQVPLCSTADLLPSIAFHFLHPKSKDGTDVLFPSQSCHAMCRYTTRAGREI